MVSTDAPCSNGESNTMEARSSKRLVEEFLLQREPIFRRLNEVRKKVLGCQIMQGKES
jgi:hypothetical protein